MAHLLDRAVAARVRLGGAPSAATIAALLADNACVRYPARIRFGGDGLEAHQFAQPVPDSEEAGAYVVLLHGALANRPDWIPLAVAYVIPVINYGPVVRPHHCERYGAALLGLSPEEYYAKLCAMADQLYLVPASPPEPSDRPLVVDL